MQIIKNWRFQKTFVLLSVFFTSFCCLSILNFYHSSSRNTSSFDPIHAANSFVLNSLEDKTNRSLGLYYALNRYNLTGSNITIAFVDTGLNLSHDVFARFNGIVPFYDVFEPDKGLQFGNPGDVLGHGTHIASIALGNNSLFHGVARNAKCVIVKIFNASNPYITDPEYLAQGLRWLLNYSHIFPLDIISMSVGMPITKLTLDPLQNLIKNFTDRGITVVSSAGNDGAFGSQTIYSPGTSPYAITVGAFNQADMELYSQTGQGPTFDGIIKPDLLAPGVMELGADMKNHNTFFYQSGTSVAVPFVSALLALLIEFCQNYHLSYSPAFLKWGLSLAAMKGTLSPNLNQDNIFGWGIVQLDPFLIYLDRLNNLTSNYSRLNIGPNPVLYNNSIWTELIPISLNANYSYSLSLNSSEICCAITDPTDFQSGLPSILSYSSNRNSFVFQVNKSSSFILIIKNCQFHSLDIKISLNYWSPYPSLMAFLFWIIACFTLFGICIILLIRRT